jgi:hypothetical protein
MDQEMGCLPITGLGHGAGGESTGVGRTEVIWVESSCRVESIVVEEREVRVG